MTPHLESVYFAGADERIFSRLARVLRASIRRHCPTWTSEVRRVVPGPVAFGTGVRAHTVNTQKLDLWVETVERCPDGTPLVLLDGDVCLVRSIANVWDEPFDLAYTTKRRPFPFNLGVCFVRVGAQTRTFFRAWQAENAAVLNDVAGARVWRAQYGGVNQASFGRLLERGALADLQTRELSCREWNCEDSTWHRFDPKQTRILHVKSALRSAIFSDGPITADLAAAVAYWRQAEHEATRVAEAG